MKLAEAGQAIGQAVQFIVGIVEEIFLKPKSGEEKKAVAIDVAKKLLSSLLDVLDISPWWRSFLKSAVNWDWLVGWLIDTAVKALNDAGLFKHSAS